MNLRTASDFSSSAFVRDVESGSRLARSTKWVRARSTKTGLPLFAERLRHLFGRVFHDEPQGHFVGKRSTEVLMVSKATVPQVAVPSRSCLRGLQEAARRLWPDNGRNPVPSSRSPLAAAILRLAELRPVSELSGAEGLSRLLAGQAGRPAGRRHRRAFKAGEARRAESDRRGVPAALRNERPSTVAPSP